MTLLEAAFYTLLVGVVGLLLTPIGLLGSRSVADSGAFTRAEERNRVTIARVKQEVRTAIATSVVVGGNGSTLSFTLPNGYDGTAIVPGANIRYELGLTPSETFNGEDDDGNGLVDEGQVTRRDLTSGEDVVIATGIDLTSSGFAVNGRAVSVTIATTTSLHDGESTFDVARTSTVFARN